MNTIRQPKLVAFLELLCASSLSLAWLYINPICLAMQLNPPFGSCQVKAVDIRSDGWLVSTPPSAAAVVE